MEREAARIRDDTASAWVTLARGIQARPMVEANGSSIILYRLEAGRSFDQHDHPFPELGVVLAGRGRLLFANEERPVRPGDSFYVPQGILHGFRVEANGPVVLMNVTGPPVPSVEGPPVREVLEIAKAAAGRSKAGRPKRSG